MNVNNFKDFTKSLHPAWVVGFIDGEGTFFVDFLKNATMAQGIQVQLRFVITQHVRDGELMQRLQEFFGCGTISKDGESKLQLRIRGFKDLEDKVFPLLDEYPLQTQKALDAQAFREVHSIIKNKIHVTSSGLCKIKAIKATINRARMK